MGKRFFLLLLTMLLLCGCSGQSVATAPAETAAPTEPTVPVTVPADGAPDSAACKGSYSRGEWDPAGTVAEAGDYVLTNEQLQVWYALAVAERKNGSYDAAPDFSQPLDTQPCPIDDSVNSWQQYFLKQALSMWHTACALELQAREQPLPTEEAYKPSQKNYETYMSDIPATDYLYGYNPLYQPNSMHDKYLEELPQTLTKLAKEKGCQDLADLAETAFGTSAEALQEAVRLYNYSYMYFTTLSYYIESDAQTVSAWMVDAGTYTDQSTAATFRQILLIPGDETHPNVRVAANGTVSCTEDTWEACVKEAEALLDHWQKKLRYTEEAFADLAYKNSSDAGSALNGGIFRDVKAGDLIPELEAWVFDPARQPGDTTVLRSPWGVHILYYSGSSTAAYEAAARDLKEEELHQLAAQARKQYPMEVRYAGITLKEAGAEVTASELLYPDVAHERFPEIPLYLQQDYPGTMYGGFELRTNGCGITSLAMLASYMADDELTPPEMCDRYGRYSHANGTDGMIFIYEPSALGFYLREKTYEPTVAKAALQEGQIVISLQHKGYWTRGGHYIVLEKITEEGLIQVRDSNLYNYGKIHGHKDDLHTWGSITGAGSAFWIFEDKVTRIPMCSRCGDVESRFLTGEYICEKCGPALLRRNAYLHCFAE